MDFTDEQMGSIGSAGVGAAGSAIGTIAQIMAAAAARNQALQQADLSRAGNMQVARMQLDANSEAQEKARAMQAKQFILSTLANAAGSQLKQFDTQRGANKAGSSLIAQAFL